VTKHFRSLPFAACLLPALVGGCGLLPVAEPAKVPPAQNIRRVAPQEAQRLYGVLTPLLRAMDKPLGPRQVRVGIIDDPSINAANAGGGNFYVTTGLLAKADERNLRGIMAHEVAHEDLGHVAQMQALGAGLNLGVYLLEELVPGSSAITPVAGELIARGYSRNEELDADRHAVAILGRAGYPKQTLIAALSWVARASGGDDGGGFLSTHPATSERIAELRSVGD
jgi:predicted Zn-dependent protease